METNVKRKGKGRKKIEIKKIDNESSRQVTFSKRRDGLFTKASELCILTGAEAAIIAFSPRDKPFTFGHPSVDTIIDRYLSGNNSWESNTNQLEQYKREYMESLVKLEDEKKREETIEEAAKAHHDKFWWEEYSIGLELEELEEYVASMEEIREKLVTRVTDMEKTDSATSPSGS